MKKRILITGGAGFIGSHLCHFFIKRGYLVRCVDNLSTGNLENIASLLVNTSFEFINVDITNGNETIDLAKECDLISHQAALGSVPRSIKYPIDSNLSNVMGFINIIESAKKHQVKRIVYASSSSVYGDNSKLPKTEENIGHPLSQYAATKLYNEINAKIFAGQTKIKFIGLRYFNVFGPKQNPNGPYAAVIPKFIIDFLNKRNPVINGDGTFTRDFTYIENVLIANELSLTKKLEGNNYIFNVAYGKRTSIIELAQIIKQNLVSKKLETQNLRIELGKEREGDVPHSFASIKYAKEILGYHPIISLEEGLNLTCKWYLSQHEKEKNILDFDGKKP